MTFADGAARKDVWLDSQSFSGKVDKSIEIGLAVANARYLITNGGVDVGDKGQVHYFPQGHHDGSSVEWTQSGRTVRLPGGAYDVDVKFRDGFIHKDVWLDNQSFTGNVDKTVELALQIAEPTVAVTQDGVDVGDKAMVAYRVPS